MVVAVHSDPNEEKMREAVRELGITWPVAQDGEKTLMKAFYADSFPDYYLIDRKGILRFADIANSEVDRAIEFLLREK